MILAWQRTLIFKLESGGTGYSLKTPGDVPLVQTCGANTLTAFEVWTREADVSPAG